MATVVDGYMRSWSGEKFDVCNYLNGEYIKEMSGCSSSNFVKWMPGADEVHPREDNESKNQSPIATTADTKQIKQFWRLRHILTAIQRSWHKQGQIKTDALKNFPLILFSPLLDRLQPRKDHVIDTGYFTDPNLASPRSTSEADLYATIAGPHQKAENLLSDPLCFIRLANPTRRHCNSESDLTWSAPNKPLSMLNQTQYPQDSQTVGRFSANESDPVPPPFLGNPVDDYPFNTDPPLQQEMSKHGEEPVCPTGKLIGEISARIQEPNEENSQLCPKVCSEFVPTLEASTSTPPNETRDPEYVCLRVFIPDETEDTLGETLYQNQTEVDPTCSIPKTATKSKIRKSVSFADEVGQSLTEIYFIENADQVNAFEFEAGYDGSMWTRRSRFGGSLLTNRFTRPRLKSQPILYDSELIVAQSATATSSKSPRGIDGNTRTLWVLGFPQPASQYYEFRQRIENGSISLENITLTQPDEISSTQLPQLSGTIKVKNLSYEKQVWLRLTTDNWKSFTDFVALYSPQLSGTRLHSASRYDTFTFNLNVVPQMETEESCDKIEFAVRYLVGPDGSWGQYWDNNGGKNYVIEKRIIQSTWPNQLRDIHANIIPMSKTAPCVANFADIETVPSTYTSQFHPYTPDYRPNFDGISQFTDYRAWTHFAGETTYY